MTDLDGIAPPRENHLIGKALFLNGYTLVDADKETVVVLGPGEIRAASACRSTPGQRNCRPTNGCFPTSSSWNTGTPSKSAGLLQQFIPPGNDVKLADERGQAVIATAPTSVMRVVIKLVAALTMLPPKPGR